jgi:hypothetical protein
VGLKWPGLEFGHTLSSSAEVNDGGAIRPLPNMSSWRCVYIFKNVDNIVSSILVLLLHHSFLISFYLSIL